VAVEGQAVLVVFDGVTVALDAGDGEHWGVGGQLQEAGEEVGGELPGEGVEVAGEDRDGGVGVDGDAELLVFGFGAEGVCSSGQWPVVSAR
jgi:hypothetical protein